MTNIQQGVDKEAISKGLESYIDATGRSLTEVARMLSTDSEHVSLKTLCEMKKHQKGGSLGLWRMLRNLVFPYLNNGIIETNDFAKGLKYADYARKNCKMVAILADTGMGKSTIKDALMLQPYTYSFYVDDTCTPGAFLRELIRNMGIWYEGTQYQMLAKVADRLNMLHQPLLIIDECAKMSDSMMLLIHSLRDKTMKNCGILLMGMPDFKRNIDKRIANKKIGYAEFNRRVNVWGNLEGLTQSEVAHILDENGITDKGIQRQFSGIKKFGDLLNAIEEYRLENE